MPELVRDGALIPNKFGRPTTVILHVSKLIL